MALQVLPVRSDIAAYSFVITLDGEIFRLRFKFNSRMDLWIMDIQDSEGNNVVVGRPLFSNTDPFRIFVQDALPDGDLLVLNLNESYVDAGEEDLGGPVKLLYEEALS